MVHWLKFQQDSNSGGTGSIPGRGNKIPHSQKKVKKKKFYSDLPHPYLSIHPSSSRPNCFSTGLTVDSGWIVPWISALPAIVISLCLIILVCLINYSSQSGKNTQSSSILESLCFTFKLPGKGSFYLPSIHYLSHCNQVAFPLLKYLITPYLTSTLCCQFHYSPENSSVTIVSPQGMPSKETEIRRC